MQIAAYAVPLPSTAYWLTPMHDFTHVHTAADPDTAQGDLVMRQASMKVSCV